MLNTITINIFNLCRPGGERGVSFPEGGQSFLSQYRGADFKNPCYTGNFRNLQPHFQVLSLVFMKMPFLVLCPINMLFVIVRRSNALKLRNVLKQIDYQHV